ncbi:MAG: cell division protein ZipA [Dyella sp.]
MTMQTNLALAWDPAIGISILVVGVIVLIALWLYGQPKQEQGVRRSANERGPERRDPTIGARDEASEPSFSALDEDESEFLRDIRSAQGSAPAQGELDVGLREELERLGATLAGERHGGGSAAEIGAKPAPASKLSSATASILQTLRTPNHGSDAAPDVAPISVAPSPGAIIDELPSSPSSAPAVASSAGASAVRPPPRSELGRRPAHWPVERIVSLFVVARDGGPFIGADLIVAAEKAGLEYGDMGIYHRMLDGKPELGPIFSMANMVKPGNFDVSRIDLLQTPGLSFFMTLPAPISALDAWDAMLPTAQRLAELLDGHVLDGERNALGRQRIAHIRDELRGWDRDHEGQEIIFGR